MRLSPIALLALAPLVAGCMEPTESTTTPFQQTCPAWIQGLSTSVFQEGFSPNSTDPAHIDALGRGLLSDENRPLDVVVFDFNRRATGNTSSWQGIEVSDGALTLTVKRDDDGASLKIYDPNNGPRGLRNPGEDYKVFLPGKPFENQQLQVDLADATNAPHPSTVTATWTFTRDSDQNPATPSQAVLFYTAKYLYRQC